MSALIEGGCACGLVRYGMKGPPLFTHCCHCRSCQRESGSAFALNALIEMDRLDVLAGSPDRVMTPSFSGRGQEIVRCPACRVALWSHYAGAGRKIAFVRVGSLDTPDSRPPDVHIFTASRQPWVVLPAGSRAFAEYYDTSEEWPPESLRRWRAVMDAA